MLERDYDGVRAYGQSKLAQIMSGFELAAHLPADEVTVNSLHPATYMPTKIVLAEIGYSIDTLEEGVTATHAARHRSGTRRYHRTLLRPHPRRTRSFPGIRQRGPTAPVAGEPATHQSRESPVLSAAGVIHFS